MRHLLLSVGMFLCSLAGFAQGTPPPPNTDTSKKIVDWVFSEKFRSEKKDSVTELQTFVGKVHLRQINTHFYADSAVYNKNLKTVEAFGNVHISDADTINIYSQYLLYHVDTRIAYLKKKVKLTDRTISLFTEDLKYDAGEKIGDYYSGGRVENKGTVLTSKEGTYYGEMKDVYFKRDVVLTDPQYHLKSDSLLYNTTTEMATFISKTYIQDSAKRNITTSEGYYDLKNKKAYFGRRPVIRDGKTLIIAETIDTDDKTGINILRGNAVYVDSAQGVSVLANYIESHRIEGTFFATQKPLMIIRQENDSIYIAADTLFSGRISSLKLAHDSLLAPADSLSPASKDTLKGITVLNPKATPAPANDSADRYFQAYRHVRIFSDSLQAVCDSLFYSGKDSVFRLFTDPVVWSGDNQVTGDTIYMYTKNKQPDRLFVFENALAVNKTGVNMYNQLKGNRLNGIFYDGTIDYMRAKGNAESVYYIMDEDSALVGINRVAGDIIDLRFKNKELDKVVVISEPNGTMFPVSQATEQDKVLRNFKWHVARRPKTKFELFGD